MEYDSEDGPWDPITGGASALLGTLSSLAMGFVDFPVEIFKAMRTKPVDVSKEGEHPISRSNTTKSPRGSLHLGSHIPPEGDEKLDPTDSSKTPLFTSDISGSEGNEFATIKPSEPRALYSSHHAENLRTSSPSPGFPHRKSTSHIQGDHASTPSSPGDLGIDPSSGHLHRSFSGNFQPGQISLDAALGASKGIGRIVGTGLKSPMDFTLSLARGFHNAPKLYGDESVRQADKITGIQSGLKAAGKVRSPSGFKVHINWL